MSLNFHRLHYCFHNFKITVSMDERTLVTKHHLINVTQLEEEPGCKPQFVKKKITILILPLISFRNIIDWFKEEISFSDFCPYTHYFILRLSFLSNPKSSLHTKSKGKSIFLTLVTVGIRKKGITKVLIIYVNF